MTIKGEMNTKEFQKAQQDWLDVFITSHGRGPKSYKEYISYVMDTLVDRGEL